MLGRALVAGAGTIANLADGSPIVRAGLVISRMTAGAIGSVCRVSPRDDFSVGPMAHRALQVATMIEWLIWRCRVAEFVRAEAIGVVAGIAFSGRAKVTDVLADCDNAVVAGRT